MTFTPIYKDGHYVALFPMTYMYCTQTWGAGTLSHRDRQTDWQGTYSSYPYYAFAPMTAYAVTSSGVIWCTDDKVWTPSGLSYLSVWCAHDAHVFSIGDHVNAGEVLGHTGTRGYVTGDHLHLDVSATYRDGYNAAYDALANDIRPDLMFYITDDYTVANLTADGITLYFRKWEGTTSRVNPVLLLASRKRKRGGTRGVLFL